MAEQNLQMKYSAVAQPYAFIFVNRLINPSETAIYFEIGLLMGKMSFKRHRLNTKNKLKSVLFHTVVSRKRQEITTFPPI